MLIRVTIALLLTSAIASASSRYTEAMFRRAMAMNNGSVTDSGRPLRIDRDARHIKISSSHLYVLITVRDSKGRSQETCIGENTLNAAIAAEHHLDTVNDERKIFSLAMSAPNRVFEFKNKKACALVKRMYSERELARIRQLVQGKSQRELRKQAQVDLMKDPNEQSELTKIYRRTVGQRLRISDPLRLAVAHVLLENGILVGEDIESYGVLYVDEWK
jgi:hypothetical protein